MRRRFLVLSLILGLFAGSQASGENLSVGLLLEGYLGDSSFYDVVNRGFEKAKGELDVQGQVIECGFESSLFYDYILDAAKKFDMVLVVGFDMMDALAKVAPNYPDTDFAVFDNSGDMGHVTFVTFRQNEGSFLAGALAAMMTNRKGDYHVNPESIIGIVCGEDIPVMRSFIAGYEQGARYINPDIKILRSFSGTWSDPEKGRAIAIEQRMKGADVVFQATGGTGEGVIAAANEGRFYAIGADLPQEYLAPGAVITSVLKRIDVAVYDIIKDRKNGRYQRGVNMTFGLKEGGVGLSYSESSLTLVPSEFRFKLDALEQDIVDGKIKVDETTRD